MAARLNLPWQNRKSLELPARHALAHLCVNPESAAAGRSSENYLKTRLRIVGERGEYFRVAVKRALDRGDFRYHAGQLRAGLLANGYAELPLEGRHAVLLASLPLLHTDPFDRLLVVQAQAEGLVLLTADKQLEQYGHPVRFVG